MTKSGKRMGLATILFILLVIAVFAVLLVFYIYKSTRDNYIVTNTPLMLNLYRPDKSMNFATFDQIQKLRFQKTPIVNPPPVILVPGLGASKLYAKWQNIDLVPSPGTSGSNNSNRHLIWDLNKYCRPEMTHTWAKIWMDHQLFDNHNDIWYLNPNYDAYEINCWKNMIIPRYHNGSLSNVNGLHTITGSYGGVEAFEPHKYFKSLIRSLKAAGYYEKVTLFGAPYDFRLIFDPSYTQQYFTNLKSQIEHAYTVTGKKVHLLGHSLGCLVTNNFLNTFVTKEWKDKHINSFISTSGPYGGLPKGLRTCLSGDQWGQSKHLKFNALYPLESTFAGAVACVPDSAVYGDRTLVTYRHRSFSAKDIDQLLGLAGNDMCKNIYNNIIKPQQSSMIQAPQVRVNLMVGDGKNTESNYIYDHELYETPALEYQTPQLLRKATQELSHFPEKYNGDGMVPEFALTYPRIWRQEQTQDVDLYMYRNTEHMQILDNPYFIRDVLNILASS